MIRLLQFTDMHLRDDPQASVRGVDPQRTFERVLYHARTAHWPPDGILLTGDIANDEFADSYPRIAGMVADWNAPTIAIPGNHDDATRLAAAFDGIPNAADSLLDFEHWRIVGLNSQVPGAVFGEIDAASWKLLEEAASTRGTRHLLVAIHHHPVTVKPAWMRDIGLRQADVFRARLSELGARACVFGHVHHAWDSIENGVRYLGTPSTGRQFAADSIEFAESDEPPAYRRLQLHDDGAIDSAVEWVRN